MRGVRIFAGALVAVAATVSALILAAAPGSAAPHATPPQAGAARPTSLNRYTVVHGCYVVSSGGNVLGTDGPYRMQAAALGQYLLYGVNAGASRSVLRRHARSAGRGVWLGRARLRRGARYIYTATGNKVSAVGVISAAALSRSGRSLHKSVRLGLR